MEGNSLVIMGGGTPGSGLEMPGLSAFPHSSGPRQSQLEKPPGSQHGKRALFPQQLLHAVAQGLADQEVRFRIAKLVMTVAGIR